ncbi:MAG: phosphotransferase [Nocardioides sp.]|uniref:phosphotransferase family protein n=1 Tax=Nocardioides sp. TaxID=35761 RepID=UPI0039E3716D
MTSEPSLRPLEGGWSGETFLSDFAGERSVVRLFAGPRHNPQAAQIQASLHRLVAGLVPVPQVREVRLADPATGTPAMLITEFVDGVRGDLLLAELGGDDRYTAGAALGEVAGTLSRIPMLRAGTFLDPDLRVEPFELWLPDWLERYADRLGLAADELGRLREVVDEVAETLAEHPRVCLVHSDLNPKNVILDPDSLTVRAVVDWEYSHAGHRFTDLGNLVRFDRQPDYLAGVLTGWRQAGLRHAGEATPSDETMLTLAGGADLVALIELAARRTANPVAARAHRKLRAIAATGDLAAPVPDQSSPTHA